MTSLAFETFKNVDNSGTADRKRRRCTANKGDIIYFLLSAFILRLFRRVILCFGVFFQRILCVFLARKNHGRRVRQVVRGIDLAQEAMISILATINF